MVPIRRSNSMFQRGYGEGMTRHLSLVARHRYSNVPHMSGLSPHQWKTRQRCKVRHSKGLNGNRLVFASRATPSTRVSVWPHRSIALTQDVDQETRTGPVLLQRNSRGGRDGAVRVE